MQRTLLASVIMLSLSACDGGVFSKDSDPIKTDIPAIDPDVITTTTTGSDTDSTTANNGGSTIGDDAASSTSDGGETTANGGSSNGNSANDSSSNGGVIVSGGEETDSDGGKYGDDDDDSFDDYDDDKTDDDDASTDSGDDNISDDAGSSTSDGGETNTDNGGTNDNTTNDDTISDDAGSSTSDGGETDDSGSSTSDGGETDDSGSSTSDGGETDDSGSSTSDGGATDDSGSSSSDGGDTTDNGTDSSDGGNFSSDNTGGSVIRTSSLTTAAQQNICTTASAQNNFSDTRVGDFILHNNAWRPFRAFPDYEWEQCIYTNTNGALVGWNYDWGPGITGINGATSPSGDFYVRSYPELIYGVKDEFRTSAPQSVTGFPVELGQMPNISIDYSYDGPQYGESRVVDASNNARFPNGTTISGERNVAIESFFYNKDAAGQCSPGIVTRNGGSNHVYEVMVWLDAGAERLPAGPSDFVTNLNIRGADYKVYTKNSDSRYIAFVAQNPQTSGTIYWNDFVDWAKENAHLVQARFGARSNSVQIQDNWCVANIIVGTEIFWGAGNLDIYNWTITQSE